MAGRLSPYLEENYYQHYLMQRLVDSEPSQSLLQNVQAKDKQFTGTSISRSSCLTQRTRSQSFQDTSDSRAAAVESR